MNIEIGKYYLLDLDKFYYCTPVCRKVKFNGTLVVKCSATFGNNGYFGKLVDIADDLYRPDYETNEDIEFYSDDVISEYKLKDMSVMYYDFPNIV